MTRFSAHGLIRITRVLKNFLMSMVKDWLVQNSIQKDCRRQKHAASQGKTVF